jgi:hypothetical protein
MLWKKGWMETRLRLLSALAVFVVFSIMFSVSMENMSRSPAPPAGRLAVYTSAFSFFFVMQAIILAGAGIKTQTPFRTSKGLHSSIHFTLALPVSRARIVATRVTLGLLELFVVILVGTIGMWSAFGSRFSELGFGIREFEAYGLTTFAVTGSCFFVTTLLSTFLDDVWQAWGSFIVIGVLGVLQGKVAIPDAINPFRALGAATPFVTHSIPWGVIGISIGSAAILLLTTLRIVQSRDY